MSKILRIPAVMEKIGLRRTTIYAYIAAGKFPRPLPLGERAVGWREEEINDWIFERAKLRKGQK